MSIKLPIPVLKDAPPSKYGKEQKTLVEPFTYYFTQRGIWNVIRVPKGFTYDGSSIPGIDLSFILSAMGIPFASDLIPTHLHEIIGEPFEPTFRESGLVHDFIYAKHGKIQRYHWVMPEGKNGSNSTSEDWYHPNYEWSRLSADKLFREMLLRYGAHFGNVAEPRAHACYEAVRNFGGFFWND